MGSMFLLERGGVVGAAFSLSVTTIGAGILTLPSAFANAGILVVLGLLILIAAFTVISIDYLILCVEKLGYRSYEDISRDLLGRYSEEAIRWMIIFYNCGVSAGYIVVVGEVFAPLLPVVQPYVPWLSTEHHMMVAVWAILMLPLSCIPQISSLHFTSFLAISATFFISIIVVFRYFFPMDIKTSNGINPEADRGDEPLKFVGFGVKSLLAWPILMFSFDCQTLVFQIHGSLYEASRKNMFKVSTLSVVVTGSIYASVGFFGYLSHGSHVKDNILANYNPLTDHIFAFAAIFYSITLSLAYALVLFPCRDAIFILLYGYSSATHELNHEAISFRDNLLASLLLSAISILVALKTPSILFIISLLGGVCSGTLCFTYPAAFRLRLHALGVAPCSTKEMLITYAMLALGIAGAVMGTVTAIWS